MSRKFLRDDGWFQPVGPGDVQLSTTTTTGFLTYATKSTTANVTLTTTGVMYDGPTVTQGSSGTWFVTGAVTLIDSANAATFNYKLWDGTTVLDSGAMTSGGASFYITAALSGVIAGPAGNLRISCSNQTRGVTGVIIANDTTLGHDSTIVAIRIG